mmetsp:Transcript_18751/g.34009  ORF Transcript_18751/g.34009 Transcript_18751/m.34009 type:complete len:1082 (+) Transcript_18751:70-3315(+)
MQYDTTTNTSKYYVKTPSDVHQNSYDPLYILQMWDMSQSGAAILISTAHQEHLFSDFRVHLETYLTDYSSIMDCPSACTSCNNGACTACANGYFLANDACNNCHHHCQTCSGPTQYDCIVCKNGYNRQPYTNHCEASCPSNSSPSSGVCSIPSPTLYLNFTFIEDAESFSYQNYVLQKSSLSYPFYREKQGIYFRPGDHLTLQPSDLKIAMQFTLIAWIFPRNLATKRTIFTNDPGPSIWLDTYGMINFSMNQDIAREFPSSLEVREEWGYVYVVVFVDRAQPCFVLFGLNDVRQSATINLIPFETSAAATVSAAASSFNGLIYNFQLYQESIANPFTLLSSVCSGSCSACPASTFCHDSCGVDSLIVVDVCVDCRSECNDGCVSQSMCAYACVSNCAACLNPHECYRCEEGYFLDSPTSCVRCPVLVGCVRCSNPSSCESCEDIYSLEGGKCTLIECTPPENCVSCTGQDQCTKCLKGFFLTAFGSCVPCDSDCSSCGDGGSCLKCKSDEDKLKDGKCVSCIEPFYWTEEGTCEKCNIRGCSICNSKGACEECDEGKGLQDGMCVTQTCSETGCIICAEGCSECNKDGCLVCEPMREAVDGVCSCLGIYKEIDGECYGKVSGELVFKDLLVLKFDSNLQKELQESDMTLVSSTEIAWRVTKAIYSSYYEVSLEAISDEDFSFELVFNKPLYDSSGVVVDLSAPLHFTFTREASTSSSSTSEVGTAEQNISMTSETASTVNSSITASTVAVSFFSGDILSLIFIMSTLQMLSYFILLEVKLNPGLLNLLAKSNLGKSTFNPIDRVMEGDDLNDFKLERLGVKSINLLNNLGFELSLALVVLFMFLCFRSLVKLRTLSKYALKIISFIKAKITLNLLIAFYTEAGLSVLVQLQNPSMGSVYGIISYVSAIVLAYYLLTFPSSILAFSKLHCNTITNPPPDFKMTWNFLLELAAPDPSSLAYLAYALLLRLSIVAVMMLTKNFFIQAVLVLAFLTIKLVLSLVSPVSPVFRLSLTIRIYNFVETCIAGLLLMIPTVPEVSYALIGLLSFVQVWAMMLSMANVVAKVKEHMQKASKRKQVSKVL